MECWFILVEADGVCMVLLLLPPSKATIPTTMMTFITMPLIMVSGLAYCPADAGL